MVANDSGALNLKKAYVIYKIQGWQGNIMGKCFIMLTRGEGRGSGRGSGRGRGRERDCCIVPISSIVFWTIFTGKFPLILNWLLAACCANILTTRYRVPIPGGQTIPSHLVQPEPTSQAAGCGQEVRHCAWASLTLVGWTWTININEVLSLLFHVQYCWTIVSRWFYMNEVFYFT